MVMPRTVQAAGQRDWLSPVLHERGHRVEGLQMCKLIPVVV